MTTTTTITATELRALLDQARAAHDSVTADPSTALVAAMAAGDALIAAKAQVKHGESAGALADAGIPPSSARLYMQLARNRERITASGAVSIREARRLVADRRPPRPRATGSRRGGHESVSDRYDEGFADGYRKGRANAAPSRRRPVLRLPSPPATSSGWSSRPTPTVTTAT